MNTLHFNDFKLIFELISSSLKSSDKFLLNLNPHYHCCDYSKTILKIANTIDILTEEFSDYKNLKNFLEKLGDEISRVSTHPSGPIWGALFSGFATNLPFYVSNFNISILKNMFSLSLKEILEVTTAKLNDKTLLDAYIPGVLAIQHYSGEDLKDMFQKAFESAKFGAENTKHMISKYNPSDFDIGTADMGAITIVFFFKAFCNYFEINSIA